jgi:hypothetical protein
MVAAPAFDPLRMLAELNALGVRYVLAGELAATAPTVPVSADRVEISVADDDDNIDRIRLFLEALSAEQLEGTDDVHHAAFLTEAGRVDCLETSAASGFGELRDRAIEVDFGHGILARATPPEEIVVVPREPRDLIGALRAASSTDEASGAGGSLAGDGDEYGPEPQVAERSTALGRVWKVLEDIDSFMNDLDRRSLRKPRQRRG